MSPQRRLSVEALEERVLLSTLTVITHGRRPDHDFPLWVYDMATAINERLPNSCTAEAIRNSKVGLDGIQPPGGCPHFLLFDWAARSTNGGEADNATVAGVLTTLVHNRLPSAGRTDLHLIGHSRGAFVVRALVGTRNEAAGVGLSAPDHAKIGWLQMTTLDPQRHDGLSDSDGVMDVPETVDWADNYYETSSGVGGIPAGQRVPGAINIDLTDVLNRWPGRESCLACFAEHQEVHDWYHWTIDTDDASVPQLKYVDPPLAAQQNQLVRDALAGSTATRKLLYSNAGVDLDGTPGADNLDGGKRAGYYLSLVGGGIAMVGHGPYAKLYTFDMRGGTPVYLGEPHDSLDYLGRPIYYNLIDVAFDPAGRLFAVGSNWEVNSSLFSVTTSFDAENRPRPLPTTPLPLGDLRARALTFRADGTLFAAAHFYRYDPLNRVETFGPCRIYRVDPVTGSFVPLLTLPEETYVTHGGMEVDSTGNLLLLVTPRSENPPRRLLRVDPESGTWTEVGDVYNGYIDALVYGAEGALYGFSYNDFTFARIDTTTNASYPLATTGWGEYPGHLLGAASLYRAAPAPPPRGSIRGTVFHDQDGNGARSLGEPGLVGQVVFIDADQNGRLDNPVGGVGSCTPGALEICVVTGSDGAYALTGLPEDTYRPRAVTPGNWIPTTASVDLALGAGANVEGQDLGITRPVEITQPGGIAGRAFRDTNRNGQLDIGEPLLKRWTVYLDSNGNDRLDSGERFTVTDRRGGYAFFGLPPGAYTVRLLERRRFASDETSVAVRSGETSGNTDVPGFQLPKRARRAVVSHELPELIMRHAEVVDALLEQTVL